MNVKKRTIAAALSAAAIATLLLGISPARAEQVTCSVSGHWNYQQQLPTGLGNGVTGTLLFSESTVGLGGTGCVSVSGRRGIDISNLPIGYSGQCALIVLAGGTPSVVVNGAVHKGMQAPGGGDFAPVMRIHSQTFDDIIAKSLANTNACAAGNMNAHGAVTYNIP